jgi:polyferredoxin
MPSKKQRRRREKLKRHEWEYVQLDEEGNEVAVEPAVLKKADAKAKPQGRRPARTPREVKPPSWSRSLRRAALFVPLLFIFLTYFSKPAPPVATALGLSVLYAVVFVPMFFFVDRLAYRAYQRRIGGG